MTPKNIVLALASLIVGVAGAAYWCMHDHGHGAASDTLGGQISGRILSQRSDDYEIMFEYPVIGNAIADKDMTTAVGGIVDNFKHDAAGAAQYMQEGQKAQLFGRFTRTLFNDHIASYLIDSYLDTGGAHGNQVFVSRTYDLSTGGMINLDAIFDDVPAALKTIQPIVHDSLVAASRELDFGPAEPDAMGIAPTLQNYSVFTLDGYSITFHFPPYQVYAYAAGPQKVIISLSDIIPLLKPQFRPQ